MASIVKHKDKWRALVFKHGVRSSKVCGSKREAQAWALRRESELDDLQKSDGKTLRTVAEHYLATVSPEKRDAVEWERRRFDSMITFFGESAKITDIDSARIGQWRDYRLKTVSGSTVQREANLLRNLFTLACDEWRLIDRNPFKGVRLPKENPPRQSIWTWQLIKRVLRAERIGKTREMQDAFHIALRTAMRLGEVLQAPENFDKNRRVVTIKTKTDARAQIPVGRIAAKLLNREPFTVGANEGSTLFSKLCRELLISGLTFHDARGSALTWMARRVDVLTLARVSRHKDLKILMSVYYRERPEDISSRLR